MRKKLLKKADAGRNGGTGLSPKRARFVMEYLVDFNATQAAIRAGYSERGARTQGARLLANDDIAKAVKKEREGLARSLNVTARRVVAELAKICFYDPRKLFDENGNPIHIPNIDDMEASALGGFEVVEEFAGKGESRELVGYTKKYKLADRHSALVTLGKYLGMFPDRHVHSGEGGGPIAHNVKFYVPHNNRDPLPAIEDGNTVDAEPEENER